MVQIEFDWLVQLANLRLDIIWKSHVWKSHSLLDYLIQGLLPIEWVIFRNLDVMAVFDDDTLADR
jgi:hypothetical protein